MMKKVLSILCIVICSLFCTLSSSAQSVSKSEMPELVKILKSQLPQTIDDALVWTNCYLRNSNSEMVVEFTIDPSKLGITSSDMIRGFNEMTPSEKKEYLGPDFAKITNIIPVPIYAIFIFPDGQKYSMRLSE
ncbi:MAG: hypothetical protein K2N05_00135 [Muribaculaceae bacterium]|nr:hypothetical protein [Muribaculaceae bacterium]